MAEHQQDPPEMKQAMFWFVVALTGFVLTADAIFGDARRSAVEFPIGVLGTCVGVFLGYRAWISYKNKYVEQPHMDIIGTVDDEDPLEQAKDTCRAEIMAYPGIQERAARSMASLVNVAGDMEELANIMVEVRRILADLPKTVQ